MFGDVFMNLNEGVPKEERQRRGDAFESFCLPPRVSVLRFRDVLRVGQNFEEDATFVLMPL